MTNQEKMNEQISNLADMMKGMFTPEELKEMEKRFDKIIKEGNEQNKKDGRDLERHKRIRR
jgi:hypothetical protein